MAQDVMWMSGVEPASIRDKNLLASQRRAHAAKISHQRRKAAKDAAEKKAAKNHVTNVFHFVGPDGETIYSNIGPRHDIVNIQYPTTTVTHSEEDQDAIQQIIKGSKENRGLQDWSDLVVSPPMATQVQDEVSVVFEQPYQQRSFHVWTTILSHRTAKYGFHCRDMFLRVIPQRSMNSPALRHMVLAHSLAHEYRKDNPHDSHSLSTRALYHYTKGLKAMYQVNLRDNDFLAAICMAFIVEAGQNNHSGSMKHIKGYEDVFLNYKGEHDEDYWTIRKCYYVMKVLGELMALGRLPERSPEPWSVEKARAKMKKIIHDMENRSAIADPLILHQHKVALGQWFNAERDWKRTYQATIDRQATLLLLHFAITLLPQYEAGDLSYESDPQQSIYLLSAAETYLAQGSRLDAKDQKQLCETLELLAVSIIRNVKDIECRMKATDLLRQASIRSVKLEG